MIEETIAYGDGLATSDSVNLGSNPGPPAIDFIEETLKSDGRKRRKSWTNSAHRAAHNPAQRSAFWRYCQQTEGAAVARSKRKGIPCGIDAYFIDRLLVDQGFRCAVSGIAFEAPRGADRGKHRKDPFGPSLDRIVPALGYTEGNLRVVCNIVNSAMNEWGLESLRALVNAMAQP